MKIRNPWIIKLIGLVGACIIRLWMATIRARMVSLGPDMDPRRKLPLNYIYAFWHENILLACGLFGRCNFAVLISQHADGEMIAQVCKHVGLHPVRGSSTRGGIVALRKMIRSMGSCHIAIVPDGPRGPRRHLEKGLVYLAAKTKMPIVPVGIGYQKPWRLNTWDRFALPRPLSRARLVAGCPINVPSDIDEQSLDKYHALVAAEMAKLDELAEQMANG